MAITAMVDQGILRYPADLNDSSKKTLQDQIAGAGRGLTLDEFSLGLNDFAVRGGEISERHIDSMLNRKAQAINSPVLALTPRVEVKLGGLGMIKDWVRLCARPCIRGRCGKNTTCRHSTA